MALPQEQFSSEHSTEGQGWCNPRRSPFVNFPSQSRGNTSPLEKLAMRNGRRGGIAVTEPKRASTFVRPETLAMLSTVGG